MAGNDDLLKNLQNNLQELNSLRSKYYISAKRPLSAVTKSLLRDQQQLPRENMNIQPFAPRKSIRHRNPYWPDEEIRTFIEIWGDDQVQASLATNFRNEAQYEWISDRMREYGYDRDMKQCRLRAKELRRGYKAIVCGNNNSVSGQRALPFYDSLNSFLCMHKGLVVSKVSLSIDRRNREAQKLGLEQEKNEKLSVVLVSDDDEASIPEPADDSNGYFQDPRMDSDPLNAQSPSDEWEQHGEDDILAGDEASLNFPSARGEGHSAPNSGPSTSLPRAPLADTDRASNHWSRKPRKQADTTSDLVDAISQVGDRLVCALSDLHSKHTETSELAQTQESNAHKEEFTILAKHVDQATKNVDKLIMLMETSTRRIADAMDRQTAALENLAQLFATRALAPSLPSVSKGQPLLSSPSTSELLSSPPLPAELHNALNTLGAHHTGDPKAPESPTPREGEESQPKAKKIKTEDD
ncbi:uncharacterized protein LOC133387226 isoform X2 [Rhineura floridana]|nr:uncharacterized protein LOC133387226 isoform X2 [Rhineura floridana]XP_061487522.1 uncharacterized protein LOC133387226 isoform X2 [Rhineura floridana]XP_061487524.1 uncharacterized protein LOC133387226 isoform X2 [Rhineura floridana]XP_061487525.1 uncharacterized protein LOC133387226 isoform X2 [Rhineura floridana]XP_061487526.1 uncharacterized protein LOC133387226 isoform X2 [Rhineura floridana]XP_061487527.1 uncharacterized protein LOC133387226 isoform X2 [Rhineura floridana]XP_06148752